MSMDASIRAELRTIIDAALRGELTQAQAARAVALGTEGRWHRFRRATDFPPVLGREIGAEPPERRVRSVVPVRTDSV